LTKPKPKAKPKKNAAAAQSYANRRDLAGFLKVAEGDTAVTSGGDTITSPARG
jgi:hypothetical protein